MNKRTLICLLVLVGLVGSTQWGPAFFGKFQKNTQMKILPPSPVLAANEPPSQWGSDPFFGLDPAVVQKQLSQPPKSSKNTNTDTTNNTNNQSANTTANTNNQNANTTNTTDTTDNNQTNSQEDANQTSTARPASSPSSTSGSSKSNDDIMRGY